MGAGVGAGAAAAAAPGAGAFAGAGAGAADATGTGAFAGAGAGAVAAAAPGVVLVAFGTLLEDDMAASNVVRLKLSQRETQIEGQMPEIRVTEVTWSAQSGNSEREKSRIRFPR
jgi:hypothetical protein